MYFLGGGGGGETEILPSHVLSLEMNCKKLKLGTMFLTSVHNDFYLLDQMLMLFLYEIEKYLLSIFLPRI